MGRSMLDCHCGGRFRNTETKTLAPNQPHPVSGYSWPYETYWEDRKDPTVNERPGCAGVAEAAPKWDGK